MKRRTLLAAAAALAQGAGAVEHEHGALPPERLALRTTLLAEGEAALARRDVPLAVSRFERAALIAHAADTELGLVRCYMQGGEYRRALAFGAHTAGAHVDEPGGTALYAWLLHAGGQEAVARQLLAQALARAPRQPVLEAAAQDLAQPWPVPGAALLNTPVRLAPYAEPSPHAAVVGTATLVRRGHAALVPVATLHARRRYWVRNGLGDTVAARLGPARVRDGLVELVLERALPAPELAAAPRDPFPGSVALAVEFAPHGSGQPAWPLLKTGFVGNALAQPGLRRLGVALPASGLRGGPVFNQHGAWVGVALPGAAGDRLLGIARLREMLGADGAEVAPPAEGPGTAGVDIVYERSLRSVLQVLRA